MLVVLVAHAVELQVGEAQPRLRGRAGEVLVLREADAVGRALHREVADLAGVPDGRQEVRRQSRLAAGELDRELAARLDRGRVVEQLLDVVPLELVDVADLVRVHEAGVAHHVAAVGQVDREDRPAPVLDRRGPVVVEAVLRNHEVAPRVERLEALEEGGVGGHHVLEVPVRRALLLHEDAAVLLDDPRLDLARVALDQDLPVHLARQNLRPHFRHAARAERIRLARKAERRKRFLPLLREGRRRPLRLERPCGKHPVDRSGGAPEGIRRLTHPSVNCSSHRYPDSSKIRRAG